MITIRNVMRNRTENEIYFYQKFKFVNEKFKLEKAHFQKTLTIENFGGCEFALVWSSRFKTEIIDIL